MVFRKSVGSLTSADRQAFVAAVKALKLTASHFTPGTTSRYDDYVYVHLQAMRMLHLTGPALPIADVNNNWADAGARMPMWAHHCPAFLPWHREFLHQFELDLQQVSNSNMAIPYWDWTIDQPTTGPPWTVDLMGGNGSGSNQAVTSGPFQSSRQWKINLSYTAVPKPNYLTGNFDGGAGLVGLPRPADVIACLANPVYDMSPWNDKTVLDTFRNQLEGAYIPPSAISAPGLHDQVHAFVGGAMSSLDTSPNDPVFFLHHSMVDRIWAQWIHKNRNTNVAPYLTATQNPNFPGQSLNESMIFYDTSLSSTPPWTYPAATPASVLDHHVLGYSYDDEATWA